MPNHVIRLDGLHFFPVRFEVISHQQRLVEQVLKSKGPVEALETAGKGSRVTNRNDHFAVQSFCKPGRGKNRKGILEQGTLTAHQSVVKDQEITPHAQNISARTE